MSDDVASVPLAEGIHHDRAEWDRATAAVLRKSGRLPADAPDSDAAGRLDTVTLDGLTIPALGTAEILDGLDDPGLPGEAPFTRGSGTADPHLIGWDVRVWLTDPATTAADVLAELENGANSLLLSLGEGGIDPAALPALLADVHVDLVPVVVAQPEDPLTAARALLDACAALGKAPHPLSNLGVTSDDPATIGAAAELARAAGVRGLVVDATVVHDRGASDVQELAYSMLLAVHRLRVLEAAGVAVDDAAGQLEFRYAVTDEQFPSIAKLRAARALWNRVAGDCGVTGPARGQRAHAVTSRPMMARYDSYTNMLRTTVAAFAAGVGGADAVTVLPFDEPLGLPTAFSRRIARDTSHLLVSESHVAEVVDPAGGAYVVERLTADLAAAAWALFAELDGVAGPPDGDLAAAVSDLDARIAAVRAERDRQIAKRRRPITGISEFPDLAETLPERDPYPVAPEVTRYAEPFEALRDVPPARPVFLATMGPIAAHTARATFITNLLAAGGISVEVAGATEGVADSVAAYSAAGAPPVVCLAGTDAAYEQWGAALAEALRAAGATHVIVAGKVPVGQDDSAALGVDALDFLRRTREVLS